ncbi:glycosyltransferase [Niabella terrae]
MQYSLIFFWSLVTLTAVLLFYYLYFFRRLAFYQSCPAPKPAAPLTVIVCARNEAYWLERHLPRLLVQQYTAAFTLLVVNDNSRDESRQLLDWMAREHHRLRPLHLEREADIYMGKKYPLSIGILEASTDRLLLTDADCHPASPLWAAKMQEGFTEGIEIVLGYGAYEKHPGWLNRIIRMETFHSGLQYLSYALAGQAYMGVGRNISYTKSLFKKNKGFASISHLPGGDDDLFISKAATARNTAIVIDNAAHTISIPEKTWRNWKRQKTRHYSTSKYYKPRHKLLLGLYSLSQFGFYPLVIATACCFSWSWALGLWLIKTAVQYIIFSRSMKKLNEADLTPWIFLIDLWMMLYYLIFAPTLWKKTKKEW